jgi:hypothetical protein
MDCYKRKKERKKEICLVQSLILGHDLVASVAVCSNGFNFSPTNANQSQDLNMITEGTS